MKIPLKVSSREVMLAELKDEDDDSEDDVGEGVGDGTCLHPAPPLLFVSSPRPSPCFYFPKPCSAFFLPHVMKKSMLLQNKNG